MSRFLISAIILISAITTTCLADFSKKKLPIPRFVTIKFNEVNARTGPAIDCPIKWIFIKKQEPVEIIAEYEQWRKVQDIDGEGGWIHLSALSSKRSVILISDKIVPIISKPGKSQNIIAKLEPGIRCDLIKCEDQWCQIACQSYKGWIAKNLLWGVY